LVYLRERNHMPEQLVLFFDSGGQLSELQRLTGFQQSATPAVQPQRAPAKSEAPIADDTAPVTPTPAVATPTPRRRRSTSPMQGTRDELIAHGGLALLFGVAVLLNGLGTILGVVSLMPAGVAWLVAGAVVGLVLHVIISRIEIAYMQWQYLFSGFLVPLLGAMILDIGTSVQGFLWLSRTLFPSLFAHGLPSDIWNWGPLFQYHWDQGSGLLRTLANEQVDWNALVAPLWAGQAWVILLVISALALGSERMLRWSFGRFYQVWKTK
jgi:hypothetical protein